MVEHKSTNMKKHILSLLALTAATTAWACTNLIVGKDASTDGSTIISYAADSYSNYGFLDFQPAADHEPGDMRKVYDWDCGRYQLSLPQPAHTYSVIGNMNEHQLTIGETTWGGREALWDTVGVDYGSLIYIALQRCKTAREAILFMVTLVEQYGYASEGETFSIGDPNEVWIMDMIGKGEGNKGANWVAVRIPDDCICAHANQARITTLPLSQKLKVESLKFKDASAHSSKSHSVKYMTTADGNWMWSKDVIDFARQKGLFSGKDKDFSYQAAYNPYDFSGLYVCEARVWSFFRHFSDDMDKYFDFATGKTFVETNGQYEGEHMPLWIRPNRKVSVRDIQHCMQDQYEGTPLDITQGPDAGPWHSKLRYGGLSFEVDSVKYWYERPIATQQTAWSFVAQMRGYADPKVGGIFWFAVDDAATSVYMPMYCTINAIPECLKEGNGDLFTYSPTSAWWAFNFVANWAYTKYDRMKPEIEVEQAKWEDKFFTQTASIDEKVANMTEEQAREFLTSYSCAQAENLVKAWKELDIYLKVKYIDGQERKMENGQFKRNAYGQPVGPNRLALPNEFLQSIKHQIDHE